jgi:hypothetical protein
VRECQWTTHNDSIYVSFIWLDQYITGCNVINRFRLQGGEGRKKKKKYILEKFQGAIELQEV